MAGPFETERAARDAIVQYEATGVGNLGMLHDAINAAGVQLGAYDREIVTWLAEQPPTVCAVIAALIARAAEPGPRESLKTRH